MLLNHASVRSFVLLAALWAGPPAPASSDTPRPDVQRPSQLQLEWTVPTACPDIDDVRARLRDRLPTVDQALSQGAAPLEVTASIMPVEQGFEGRIELRNREGATQRMLGSRDCSLLTDAIVLVIAVTLDPVTTAAHDSQRRIPSRTDEPGDEPSADTRDVDPAAASLSMRSRPIHPHSATTSSTMRPSPSTQCRPTAR